MVKAAAGAIKFCRALVLQDLKDGTCVSAYLWIHCACLRLQEPWKKMNRTICCRRRRRRPTLDPWV